MKILESKATRTPVALQKPLGCPTELVQELNFDLS